MDWKPFPVPKSGDFTYQVEAHDKWGTQTRIRFPNGMQLSVVNGPHTYGRKPGIYEVAVMHDDDRVTAARWAGSFCECHPLIGEWGDVVLGWVRVPEVLALMDTIKQWPVHGSECRQRTDGGEA